MLRALKKVITPLVLTSFLLVAFFGFTAMSYGPDGRMEGGCPFSVTGATLCPQDAVAVVLHHLSAYQSFFSVPIGSITTDFVIALFLVAASILLLTARPPLFKPLARRNNFSQGPPVSARTQKITHWLSLL